MKDDIRAFIAEEKEEGKVTGSVGSITPDQLGEGDVTIEVEYSSLNFKDALAASGLNRVARSYPHVPGIDCAGVVAESASDRFSAGDRVLITGYDLGVAHWGGYAEYVRAPAEWIVKTPDDLSNFDAMANGTAGFTAAMCIRAMERNGTTPESGPILVTGATGGVGSLAVAMLAGAGYTVAASTGKADQHDYLRELGASEILGRDEVSLGDEKPRPMLKGLWAGAVDTVGGATTAHLIRSTMDCGNIALCGLVGGMPFNGNVAPFLLRGANLLGINSVTVPMAERDAIWADLTSRFKLKNVAGIAREVKFEGLGDEIAAILKGQIKGRVVVSTKA